MACSACSANVERCLNKIEGVREATVSLSTRTATIDYDEGIVTLATIKEAVNAIGFDLVFDTQQSAEEIERTEYRRLRRKTIVSWCLALIVMALTMGWLHIGNQSVTIQTQMLLAVACMLYCGGEFYTSAFRQLRHHTANMDTLVALSTGIAFAMSVVNTFWGDRLWGNRGIGWQTYYDTPVMIITFVTKPRSRPEPHRRARPQDYSRSHPPPNGSGTKNRPHLSWRDDIGGRHTKPDFRGGASLNHHHG